MKDKERNNLINMLSSVDDEMAQLGMSMFSTVVLTKEDYFYFMKGIKYDNIPLWIKRYIRSIFINSHSKLRRKYK